MAYLDDHKLQARTLLTGAANASSVTRRMLVAMSVLSYKGAAIDTVTGLAAVGVADTADGYDCVAIYHAASKRLIFVNRGAEGALSQRDWIEGAQAAFGKSDGPLSGAIDFFTDMIGKLAQNQLPGVSRDDVHEVLATGHSWGGALAEAQIALGPSILDDFGYEGLPFSGVGIASAGFANAIENLSAARNLPISSEIDWSMSHFIRRNDPIRIPGHRTLGAQTVMPGIWIPTSYFPPRGVGVEWFISAEASINHDAGLYFDQFNVDDRDAYISEAGSHYYLAKRKKLIKLTGEYPARTRFGTTHPDKVLGP